MKTNAQIISNSPGLWPLACSNPFVPFSTCLTLSFLVLLSFCRPLLSFDACVYLGPPPGGRGSRKLTTRARIFHPYSDQNRTLDRFVSIFEAFERYPISALFSVWFFSYTRPLSSRFRLPFWRYFCSIYTCFLQHYFHNICCIVFCRFVPTPTCKNLSNIF